MSGADLCKAIGLSSGVYSQWNTKRNKISNKNLKKIADIFGISVMSLFDDNDENEKTATNGDGNKKALEQLMEIIPTLTEEQAQILLPKVSEIVSAPRVLDDL